MELLRIGITSTLVAAWYAAVLTLVGCTAAAGHGGEAAATDDPELPVSPVDADLAAQLTGGYHNHEMDTANPIWSDDGRLRLRMGRNVTYDLDVVGPDTLAFAGGRLAVLRTDRGRVRGLGLSAGRMGRLVLDREGVPPEIVIPRGRPAVVDGRAGDREWSDALLLPLEVEAGWTVDVRVKHDGEALWVAFGGLRDGITRVPEVLLDALHDGGNTWGEDDWWLHASYQDCTARGHHNDYGDCTPEHPWLIATNLSDGDRYPELMEMRIPFNRTGLAVGRTVGIAFNVTDTQRVWRFWPREAQMGSPGSWAAARMAP